MNRSTTVATALLLPVLFLAACSTQEAGSPSSGTTSISVNASDSGCVLSESSVDAGSFIFDVTNNGNEITEVYVYGENNSEFTKVVSEVENIGPGVSRSMTADLTAGTYEIACKPGQTGTGIRTKLTVNGAQTAPTETPSAQQYREIPLTITAKDSISGLTGTSATVGESIEFAVVNSGNEPRIFEVKKPDGTVAGEVEIAAGKGADLYIDTNVSGNWLVIVEGGPVETEQVFSVK
jgi:hypothetical protein